MQTMQTYQQATERSIAGLFPPTITKDKKNWCNTIHIKNANKKTKMITPPSTDKDKTKVISPQITSKGNCKEKHDLTTNHRQRLPGWRLFRLGKGTTLDRVQSLYPERNYFFVISRIPIPAISHIVILRSDSPLQCTSYKHVLKRNKTKETWRQTW